MPRLDRDILFYTEGFEPGKEGSTSGCAAGIDLQVNPKGEKRSFESIPTVIFDLLKNIFEASAMAPSSFLGYFSR